jgi:hypothetical protein
MLGQFFQQLLFLALLDLGAIGQSCGDSLIVEFGVLVSLSSKVLFGWDLG